MERIRHFLKQDSNLLRNILLFLVVVTAGPYKAFIQPDASLFQRIMGWVFMISTILVLLEIIQDIKKLKR